mmetsp:Transcript_15880/g.31684  ORF Transcript_15880/g.31684 Transcript_15880/m.31684 type:complete len:271 (-) Transcript_15880:127-939(-)
MKLVACKESFNSRRVHVPSNFQNNNNFLSFACQLSCYHETPPSPHFLSRKILGNQRIRQTNSRIRHSLLLLRLPPLIRSQTGTKPKHRRRNHALRPPRHLARVPEFRIRTRRIHLLHQDVVFAQIAIQNDESHSGEETGEDVQHGLPSRNEEHFGVFGPASPNHIGEKDYSPDDQCENREGFGRLPFRVHVKDGPAPCLIGVSVTCFENVRSIDVRGGGPELVGPDSEMYVWRDSGFGVGEFEEVAVEFGDPGEDEGRGGKDAREEGKID